MMSIIVILAVVLIIAVVAGGIVWAAREDYKDAKDEENKNIKK